MDAPPVQYAKTQDGFNIAFSVSGQGRPLVMVPAIFVDLVEQWRLPSHRLLFEELSRRFRVIRIDYRGTGLSTRRVDSDFEVAHICRDIDAVAGFLTLPSFALYGGTLAGQAAVLYADAHPDRVEALVLCSVAVDKIFALAMIDEELARASFELFVQARQPFFAPLEAPSDFVRAAAGWVSPDDLFAIGRRVNDFTLEPILPRVSTPALVLARRGFDVGRTGEERAHRLASLLPNAKCVELHGLAAGLFSTDGSIPPAVLAIEEFLSTIPPFESHHKTERIEEDGLLSPREIEVLHLLAAGKTNQEIADELVISLNTVRRHVSNIFDKTGVANRAQAAVYARDHGLA